LAGDSTGLESRHVSRYFAFRQGRRYKMSHWPKLSATCDCATHLFLSAKVTHGPRRDTCEAPAILRAAARRVHFRRALLDAGYDSEAVHILIREELLAHSVIPPTSGRPTRKWPRSKYRRQMKRRFFRRVYGQRWQIENVFSRYKRLLGSALRATSWTGQKREASLRVLVHNLMLLKRLWRTFLQSTWVSEAHMELFRRRPECPEAARRR